VIERTGLFSDSGYEEVSSCIVFNYLFLLTQEKVNSIEKYSQSCLYS